MDTRTQIRGIMAHNFVHFVSIALRGGGERGSHTQTEVLWTFASMEDLTREYAISEYFPGRVHVTTDLEVGPRMAAALWLTYDVLKIPVVQSPSSYSAWLELAGHRYLLKAPGRFAMPDMSGVIEPGRCVRI